MLSTYHILGNSSRYCTFVTSADPQNNHMKHYYLYILVEEAEDQEVEGNIGVCGRKKILFFLSIKLFGIQ